jgi:hypothetical protein
VKDESLYHHSNTESVFFGVQSAVIFPFHTSPVKAITAHVHPFASIVKVLETGAFLKQRTGYHEFLFVFHSLKT